MKIAISAETTIDMPQDLLNQFNIHTIPFTIILGETEELDGKISNERIFEYVKENNTLPKTSAINREQYKKYFLSLLKEYDVVIHFSLSGEMSSAYHNAREVSGEIAGIYVVDSRSLSTGIGLLAIHASEMVEQGKSAHEIVDECTQLTSKVRASFVLDKLDYLHKGGRCSAIKLFGANLLSLKPQILVKDGVMKVGKKYVGKYEKVVGKYFEDTLNACSGFDTSHAFVTCTTATEETIALATQALTARGFKNIHYTHAGGTITCHCGPNTIGILFIEA